MCRCGFVAVFLVRDRYAGDMNRNVAEHQFHGHSSSMARHSDPWISCCCSVCLLAALCLFPMVRVCGFGWRVEALRSSGFKTLSKSFSGVSHQHMGPLRETGAPAVIRHPLPREDARPHRRRCRSVHPPATGHWFSRPQAGDHPRAPTPPPLSCSCVLLKDAFWHAMENRHPQENRTPTEYSGDCGDNRNTAAPLPKAVGKPQLITNRRQMDLDRRPFITNRCRWSADPVSSATTAVGRPLLSASRLIPRAVLPRARAANPAASHRAMPFFQRVPSPQPPRTEGLSTSRYWPRQASRPLSSYRHWLGTRRRWRPTSAQRRWSIITVNTIWPMSTI